MVMMNLNQLREKRDLVNSIDWSMTPEKAVEMYLEWGTGWVRGNDFVASSGDESVYFVIYDWETPPRVTLIRRTVEGAEELGQYDIPEELFAASWKENGTLAGGTVHPPNEALKKWLCDQIDGPPLDWSRMDN
jgi:hypothetical protein